MDIKHPPTNETEHGPEAESSMSHCCNHQCGERDVCILLAPTNRVQMFRFCSNAKNGNSRCYHETDFFFSSQACN